METAWKKRLRREASARHMCAENRTALEEVENRVEAIALYKKTIDWALENDYPELDTIREYFSDCNACGIFVDRHFTGQTLNSQQAYVFHHCTGTVRTGLNVEKKLIPMMYFANGCSMTVEGDSPTHVRVPLYVFGDNDVVGVDSDEIETIIFKK